MKKLFLIMFIAVLLTGSLFAQERGNRQNRENRPQRSEIQEGQTRARQINPITVDGILKLERGFIAIESGNVTYTVPMLTRYIGFISDLREGARVSIEGFGFRNFIQPVKVTINSRTYEFNNRMRMLEQQNFTQRRENTRPNSEARGNFSPSRRNAPGGIKCNCGCD
ncbi:MAG: hypothetical protein FWD24_00075 [Treponema sp.]|nr:hypothetical protein [Treponema sp.]